MLVFHFVMIFMSFSFSYRERYYLFFLFFPFRKTSAFLLYYSIYTDIILHCIAVVFLMLLLFFCIREMISHSIGSCIDKMANARAKHAEKEKKNSLRQIHIADHWTWYSSCTLNLSTFAILFEKKKESRILSQA